MNLTAQPTTAPSPVAAEPQQFTHQIEIRPLGHLYGSAGPFLSPDHLVGRAGQQFPPSAMTFAGLVAAVVADAKQIQRYQFAGPFWAKHGDPENIYIPTPLNCLVKNNQIQSQMAWHGGEWQAKDPKTHQWQIPKDDKYQSGTWISLATWQKLDPGDPQPLTVEPNPWKSTPHLHPRLNDHERTTREGDLFLENVVELNPDVCLVYFCNHAVEPGWYRFGGEGHIVELSCRELGSTLQALLAQDCGQAFATLTPAVWGSNRRSLRSPRLFPDGQLAWPRDDQGDLSPEAEDPRQYSAIASLLTGKPIPLRHRIGKPTEPKDNTSDPTLLARGRYAMPPGTVYVLEEALNRPWCDWPLAWFPTEGYSYQRFGSGLALPLKGLIN